jgi:hypothetical protein
MLPANMFGAVYLNKRITGLGSSAAARGRIANQLALFTHQREAVAPARLAGLTEFHIDMCVPIVVACDPPFEAERDQRGRLDREFSGGRIVLRE